MVSFLGKTEEKAGAVSAAAAAPSESEPAATAAKKEETPEVSAAPAGAQSGPVERQDSRQGGAGKHQRLGKTNSSGSQAGERQAGQPGDSRPSGKGPEGPVRQGGPGGGQQHRGPAQGKRTEGPKSPVTSAKWHPAPGVTPPV